MLAAGSVTVDPAGVITGTGLAKALYDAMVAINIDPFAGSLDPASIVSAKQGLANGFCNPVALATIPYLVTNTEVGTTIDLGAVASTPVVIFATDSGLQRTPNPNTPDTATQGPAANQALGPFSSNTLTGTTSGTIS